LLNNKFTQVALIILLILLADQCLKFWVKTHMYLGEEYNVLGGWFRIHFTENQGMAFGLQFGGSYGKFILSIFRLLAVGFIGYYLHKLIRQKAAGGLIISLTLILAGALGNITDSTFYGLLFSESFGYEPAVLFPEGGGYASFLYGSVVDMFYFPILEGVFPYWVPFWGGEEFIFFRPVFNIADSAITIGVAMIILFQRKYFKGN